MVKSSGGTYACICPYLGDAYTTIDQYMDWWTHCEERLIMVWWCQKPFTIHRVLTVAHKVKVVKQGWLWGSMCKEIGKQVGIVDNKTVHSDDKTHQTGEHEYGFVFRHGKLNPYKIEVWQQEEYGICSWSQLTIWGFVRKFDPPPGQLSWSLRGSWSFSWVINRYRRTRHVKYNGTTGWYYVYLYVPWRLVSMWIDLAIICIYITHWHIHTYTLT